MDLRRRGFLQTSLGAAGATFFAPSTFTGKDSAKKSAQGSADPPGPVGYPAEHDRAGHSHLSVRVAAISMKPNNWDKEANAAKMEDLFSKAAKLGAQLAVVTETALQGFIPPELRSRPELVDRFIEVAEPLEGTYVRRFRQLAEKLKMCLVLGLFERAGDVYNTSIFIDHGGRLCGKYQKMDDHGYGKDLPYDIHYRAGKQIRAFDTPFGRAGMLICADRWNPMIARTLVLDGGQVIYLPSLGSNDVTQDCAVLARARENGVPIVQANRGENLIISKGEIIAHELGDDRITAATIDIPRPPSKEMARRMEQTYLEWQAEHCPVSGPSTWGKVDERSVWRTVNHLRRD